MDTFTLAATSFIIPLSLLLTGKKDKLQEAFAGLCALENLIERMMLLAKSNIITLQEIPGEFKAALDRATGTQIDDSKKPFKDFMRNHMEDVERQMIIKCLEESGGNVTKAAKESGLSRKGLQLKMIKYGLRK